VRIPYQSATHQGDSVTGNVPILDIQYGNVWTNINDSVFRSLQVPPGKNMEVIIRKNDSVYFRQVLPFVNTFGDVPEGKTLAYLNSLMNFSLAINMGNFSDSFHVQSGPEWTVVIKKAD
jgi:S-adenosylmethionine hydrolase